MEDLKKKKIEINATTLEKWIKKKREEEKKKVLSECVFGKGRLFVKGIIIM